eukprot:6013143-Lingulodinium_polyedra.AAC.1
MGSEALWLQCWPGAGPSISWMVVQPALLTGWGQLLRPRQSSVPRSQPDMPPFDCMHFLCPNSICRCVDSDIVDSNMDCPPA